MFGLGMQELIIVGIVAVLLFGKRLPEVARSLGKSYNEFRRGLNDIHSSVNYSDQVGSYGSSTSSTYSSGRSDDEDYDAPTAPKFIPPAAEPQPEADTPAQDEPT